MNYEMLEEIKNNSEECVNMKESIEQLIRVNSDSVRQHLPSSHTV